MNKRNSNSIGEKRNKLAILYETTTFKALKTINAMAVKSANNNYAVFDNLIDLIADTGILYQAIGNISKKKGALTEGPPMDKTTADGTSKELVEKLASEIKSGSFRFKPIRRVYMDKSGKNLVTEEQRDKLKELHSKGKVTMDQIKELKARPLGISSFPDKIIQEAMRIILNAIYEPEFAKYNCNFGFRSKYGCADAIAQIKAKAKQMDYAIEGDIKGAFDNVNHETLIRILRKKIKDEKFLSLINGGLKCGVIYLKFRLDSDIGTTQGSVVSPLLYNIYFHEFDKFIYDEFKINVDNINKEENRVDRPVNKLYNSISKKKTNLRLKSKLETINRIKNKPNFDNEKLKKLQKDLTVTLKKYKALDKEHKKVTPFAKSRQTIRFTYHRYADDWVFLTNAELNRISDWKEIFAKWISDNLELTLSQEKTKITDLRKGGIIRFLGYQLKRQTKRRSNNVVNVGKFTYKNTDIARRYKKEKIKLTRNRNKIEYKTRSVNPSLIVTWDRSRVLPRMELNNFIRKTGNTYRGKSKNPWTALQEPEIIQRYNYIIRGYVNYYATVTDYPTDVLFLFYLLKLSCAHTLAQKRNTSLRKTFRKFGKDINIYYLEKVEKLNKDGNKEITEKKKCESLLNWSEILDIIRKVKLGVIQKSKDKQSISAVMKSVDDICKVKINWRTAYKLSQHCTICGSKKNVEYHHVKHIRKGKVTGFLQVLKQFNRKQIPCCKICHNKIHKGLYDSLPLDQLYDEELIIL